MSSSSVTGHAVPVERPGRSRNAKAQARHRAKRKAYIEQLEQTVTKLQTSLGLSHEEIAVLPPPLIRIRELEQENDRLVKENDDFRRTLADLGRSQDGIRRSGLPSYIDPPRNTYERIDYKRKKFHDDPEGEYMSPSDTPPQHQESSRPPPLTIPQPLAQYQYPSANHQALSSSSSLFNLNATPTFQMPNTPSSSATSSPPFSPQLQAPLQSPLDHRPSPIVANQHMSNYSSRYPQVKIEEDAYGMPQTHYGLHHQTESYAHSNSTHNNGIDGSWHGYSSERSHMHR